jgi:hypothetical protein
MTGMTSGGHRQSDAHKMVIPNAGKIKPIKNNRLPPPTQWRVERLD